MTTPPTPGMLSVDGGAIHLRQWSGPGSDAPHLLFLHATGMCAAVYDRLLAPLSAVARITAYDARGHGRTTLPADPSSIPADWRIYRQDLKAVANALGSGPLLLAGHSFGATTALEAAVEQPGLASRLLLIDPPFVDRAVAPGWRAARDGGSPPPNPMADRAARRSGHFPSREAARAAWHGRGVFAGWSEDDLQAYVDGALLPAEGGGFDLACRPAWEAATYRGVSSTFEDSLDRLDQPFALLAATDGSTVGADAEARIRSRHSRAPIHRLAGAGHFLPLTHQDATRAWLCGLVSGDFPDR